MKIKNFSVLFVFILTACGGGGGGGGGDTSPAGGGPTTPPAPTVSLSSSVSSVEVNVEFNLTWSSTNATSCTASGDWSDAIETSGTKAITETSAGTKTYTITCSGAGGSATDSVSVTVTNPPPEPTATISSSALTVEVDDSFTLTWSSTDASSCSASGDWSDAIETSGTKAITETDATTKTYTITCTGAGGSATASVSVTVNAKPSSTSFSGYAIDGYVSGANIFIDQNFNFKQDDGELTAVTAADGSFTIETNDETVANCLKKRPIVADVPVGAYDSTAGGVTEAYQMILPSLEDAGTNTIVISPFTSLFAEAIITARQNIDEGLTVAEGCESEGDTVANKISERINELKTSIENSFGITYAELLSDFIADPGTEVNESTARNIAKLLPPLKVIDNQVSDYLTQTFNKEIRANVSLSEESLTIIFSGEQFEELPLNFYSSYSTEPNSDGWYRNESLEAKGALITDSGILKRAHCSETDTALCNISELTLKNVANASTSFHRQSAFSKNTSVNFNDLGVTDGSISVTASKSSSWRNDSANWTDAGNRNRECQKNENIQFTNQYSSELTTQFNYNLYSQGFEKADCDEVRHYYTPILRASTALNNDSNTSLEVSYYIFDLLRSGISTNLPSDFVSNSVSINPEPVIKDIASLPRLFSQIDTIRGLFRGNDYILFEYHKDGNLNAYFEAGTNPSNDMYWDLNVDGSNRIYGQDARTNFYNRLMANSTLPQNFYGSSAPINSSVLGRIDNSYIEITDYSGSDEINLQITPTYDFTSKTLDYSLVGSLDLENIHDFISNGINGNPVFAKIWFNPDSSINSTVPVKLSLFQGDDTTAVSGEGYFTIIFDLEVTSSETGNDNNDDASQIWSVPSNSKITVTYTEDSTVISKEITNTLIDSITIEDSNTGTSDSNATNNYDRYIQEPNLNIRLLSLLSNISDVIPQIKSFFTDSSTYTFELDLISGGHNIVGFDRNSVEKITGSFKTKSTPEYPISVNDLVIKEDKSENICFTRPSQGDTSATSFNLSFTQRERPGKGGFENDFSLSSSEVVFNNGDTESCIVFNAVLDTHFDWAHDIYLDISNPSNGQALSRSRMKVTIEDLYFPNRIDWRRK